MKKFSSYLHQIIRGCFNDADTYRMRPVYYTSFVYVTHMKMCNNYLGDFKVFSAADENRDFWKIELVVAGNDKHPLFPVMAISEFKNAISVPERSQNVLEIKWRYPIYYGLAADSSERKQRGTFSTIPATNIEYFVMYWLF